MMSSVGRIGLALLLFTAVALALAACVAGDVLVTGDVLAPAVVAGVDNAAAPVEETHTATVTGVVTSEDGPMEGVTVRVQATDNATLTTADGAFVLGGLTSGETVTVTASAPGHYIGWTRATAGLEPVQITLNPHFIGDNFEYEWTVGDDGLEGSASCGSCHTSYAEWLSDGHSQAAVNPRFLTMYEGTDVHGNKSPPPDKNNVGIPLPPDPDKPYHGPGFKLDFPNIAGSCATCHTPIAGKISNAQNCGWSGCHKDTTADFAGQALDRGVSPLQLTGDAAEGISCEFCHKIGQVYFDPKTDLPYTDRPGILAYRLFRPTEGHDLIFGSVDDIARTDIPEPRDVYLPMQSESKFCSGCHYGVLGGVVVGNMETKGGVLVYSSYSEWLDSPYSDPETGKTCQDCHMRSGDYDYFAWPARGGVTRDPEQVHNHDMLTTEMIQEALTLDAAASVVDGAVVVDVDVINENTGHHVPTDSPMRHVMLIVEAVDGDGAPLPLLDGPQLPDWAGDYATQPGRGYAKLLRDEWTNEMPTASVWRPVQIEDDTRIPAMGHDASSYRFALPEAGGATVNVKLVYRIAFQQLMEWKGWTDPDIVMQEMTIDLPAE